jgi:hypothetical protein
MYDYLLLSPPIIAMSPEQLADIDRQRARSAIADREQRERARGFTPGATKRFAEYMRRMIAAQTGD